MSPGLLWLYPVGIIWSFVCTSCINLAFSSVAFINLPQDDQTLYVGFYSTANFLAALGAATLARAFVTRLAGVQLKLLGVVLGEKQLLMLLVGCLMALVGTGVAWVARKNKMQGVEH